MNHPAPTVAMRLVETLKGLGVRHVFGVPSGGLVDYLEALRATPGIDFVLTSDEGAAAFMAAVSGRLRGVPGVCFGTLGPGATNLATGVGGALLDRCPLIAFTDELPAALRGRTTQMGIDHQALFRPLTKRTTRLEPDRIGEILTEAAVLALSEPPGPVHVGLPLGLGGEAAPGAPNPIPATAAAPPAPPAPAALDAIAARLAESTRPLLAVGLSAVRARAGARIQMLAARLGAPVVLTPMAKGLVPDTHPSYAGVLFHALESIVAETCAGSDLIVAIGYDPVEYNLESWVPEGVPVIAIDPVAVDVDRSRVRLVAEAVGDISVALDRILEAGGGGGWDLEALAVRRRRLFERLRPRAGPFGPCAALDALRRALPDEAILTCDVGAHTHLIGQQWPTPSPDRLLMTNGWSAMGFGLPAAIAAKLCRPEVPVAAVIGDGGLLMSAGELATAARVGLPLLVVVLNDRDLALIRIKQQRRGHPIYGTAVGAGGWFTGDRLFGVPVLSASDPAAFEDAVRTALEAPGPVLVEAKIDSREYDDLVLR